MADSNAILVSLWGSDNLQDWTFIAQTERHLDSSSPLGSILKLSQLRTPPAARSWRYYTICIGGLINTDNLTTDGQVMGDADFGPILVDYQPVKRRIG